MGEAVSPLTWPQVMGEGVPQLTLPQVMGDGLCPLGRGFWGHCPSLLGRGFWGRGAPPQYSISSEFLFGTGYRTKRFHELSIID